MKPVNWVGVHGEVSLVPRPHPKIRKGPGNEARVK